MNQSPHNSPHNETWDACLEVIKQRIPDQTFETWFQPVVPVSLHDHTLTVEVPSKFYVDWIEAKYRELLQAALREADGDNLNIAFSIADDADDAPGNFTDAPKPPTPFQTDAETKLNPRYTFDNFVQGSSNQFARTAALTVAEAPGTTNYNPLVIYGGVGLGKTHLLQAIGNFAREKRTARRILYVSSERFTLDFINSIQKGETAAFSLHYRNVDLLLVDDIQFFVKKEATQEQFFHTFNELYHADKQIVLTSDKPTKDLHGLEERLLSRFQSGLTTDVQPPDLETRMAILQKKADQDGIELPYDVIEFLSTNIQNNIRELEGSLIRLLAYASLTHSDIDLELARRVLEEVVGNGKTDITIPDVIRMTAEELDINENALIGKGRRKEVAIARQIAMYLARTLTGHSLKTVGLNFGGRDHSTVVHACKLVERRCQGDPAFLQRVDSIRRKTEYCAF